MNLKAFINSFDYGPVIISIIAISVSGVNFIEYIFFLLPKRKQNCIMQFFSLIQCLFVGGVVRFIYFNRGPGD